jgi:hypothetical protein
VIGEALADVPAGRFNVWIVERIEEGQFGNGFRGELVYYIHKQTGAVVKLSSRIVRGTANYSPSWEAVSFVVR